MLNPYGGWKLNSPTWNPGARRLSRRAKTLGNIATFLQTHVAAQNVTQPHRKLPFQCRSPKPSRPFKQKASQRITRGMWKWRVYDVYGPIFQGASAKSSPDSSSELAIHHTTSSTSISHASWRSPTSWPLQLSHLNGTSHAKLCEVLKLQPWKPVPLAESRKEGCFPEISWMILASLQVCSTFTHLPQLSSLLTNFQSLNMRQNHVWDPLTRSRRGISHPTKT